MPGVVVGKARAGPSAGAPVAVEAVEHESVEGSCPLQPFGPLQHTLVENDEDEKEQGRDCRPEQGGKSLAWTDSQTSTAAARTAASRDHDTVFSMRRVRRSSPSRCAARGSQIERGSLTVLLALRSAPDRRST